MIGETRENPCTKYEEIWRFADKHSYCSVYVNDMLFNRCNTLSHLKFRLESKRIKPVQVCEQKYEEYTKTDDVIKRLDDLISYYKFLRDDYNEKCKMAETEGDRNRYAEGAKNNCIGIINKLENWRDELKILENREDM